MWPTEDTIAAIASPKQQLLRSIVRLSGPAVADVLSVVVRGSRGWRSAQSSGCWEVQLLLPDPLGAVPCTLIYWPDARSYTRQPAAELHLPPGVPIADACLAACCEHGARLAQPGEFTLRAFLAGRIDLTQAEAVLAVIDAQSESELKTGLRQLAGNLGKPLAHARQLLLDALSHLEAGLDFADEDIEFISSQQLQASVQRASAAVAEVLDQAGLRGESEGPPLVVLYGRSNSGKSSLFNRLCNEERAIVSPMAGTTRDYLTAIVKHQGVTMRWMDTAGHDPSLPMFGDAHSQSLAEREIETAAVRLLCLDGSAEWNDWEHKQLQATDSRRVVVVTKLDVATSDWRSRLGPIEEAIACSSHSGEGIDGLAEIVSERIRRATTGSEVAPSTLARSRYSLQRAAECLELAQQLAHDEAGEELVAAELRTALEQLGDVAGQLHHEEVLDQVFRQFCIGK